ncbi:putative holin-like toxin [Streptococcus mitis]|nr:putative holin-like toxin [Streptococcus sp. NLN76]MBG9367013.1 putative holin-like toxin [Streptococcus sp. NLN64]
MQEPPRKEIRMSVEAAIGLMLQFGILLLALLTFIVLCINHMNKK